MEIFWSTISSYNAATLGAQIIITLIAAALVIALYLRPSNKVRVAMKIFMAFLNFWIAIAYYLIFGDAREYNEIFALFWAIMGGIWVYDLTVKHHVSLEYKSSKHRAFAILLFLMPLLYPAFSLVLGRSFPSMTTPVMPCSVAIFTIGIILAFSERVNIILSMFLCHWALIGISKVYFYGIPEDYLLAFCAVPALYIFFREYLQSKALTPSKMSSRILSISLFALCIAIGAFFTYALLHNHLLK